jgi:hypothetical protein
VADMHAWRTPAGDLVTHNGRVIVGTALELAEHRMPGGIWAAPLTAVKLPTIHVGAWAASFAGFVTKEAVSA